MERIYPVTQAACTSYIGRSVCAILHDGTHVVGTLDGVNERGLVFKEAAPGVQTLSTDPKKAKKQLTNISKNVKTTAFGYGYGYGGYALDWALIALLFALPFFFI